MFDDAPINQNNPADKTKEKKLPGDQQTATAAANDAASMKGTLEGIPRVPAKNQDADEVANNQRNIVTPTGSAGAREIVHADGRKEQVQVSHDKDGTQNYYVRNEQGEFNQYKVKDNHTLVSDKGHELSLKTQLEPDRKLPESSGTAAVSNSLKEAPRILENPSQNKSEQKQEQLQQKFEAQKAEPHFESQQKNLAEEKREKYPQVDPAAFKKDDAAQVKISESDRTPVRAPEGLLRSSNEVNSKAPDSLKDIMKSDLYPNGLPVNQNDKVKSQQSPTESNRTPETSLDNSSSKNLTSADRNAKVDALNDSSKQLVPTSESQQQLQQHKVGGPLSSIGDGHKDTIDKKSDTPSGNDKNTKFDLDPKAALLAVAKADSAKSSGGGGGGFEKSDDKKAGRAPVSKPGTDDKSGSSGVGTGIGSDRGSERTSKNPDRLPPDVKPELKAMLTQTDPSHRNILATVLSNFQSDSEQKFSTKDQPLVDKLRELTAEQIKALNAWVTGKQGSALDTHNTADYQHKLTDILKTLLIPADKNVVSKSPEAIDSKNQLKTLIAELTKQQTDHLSELVSKMMVSPGRKLGGVDQLIGIQLRKLDPEQLSTLKECLKSKNMQPIDKIGGDLQFTVIVVLSILSGKADKPVAEKNEKIPAPAQPTKEMLERVEEALKAVPPIRIQCDRGRPPRPDKEAAAADEDISENIRAQRKKDRRTKTKRMKESAASVDAAPVDENQTKEAENNREEEEKVEEQRPRSGSESIRILSETATQKVFEDDDKKVVRITKEGDLKTKYKKTLEWWNEENWHLVAEFKLDYGTGYLTQYKRNSTAVVTSRHYPGDIGLTSLLHNTFDRIWKEYVEAYK